MRLTETLCESMPEVAVMVMCDVIGVAGGVEGGVGAAAMLVPLLQPDIVPIASMQMNARMEPRRRTDRLRRPTRPSRPSGSSPASTIGP